MAKKKTSKKTTSKPASKATSESIVRTLKGALFPCSDEWIITIPGGMELTPPTPTKTGGQSVKLRLTEGVAGKIHLDPMKLLKHKADFKLERKKD